MNRKVKNIGFDPSLHLFIDDKFIRNLVGMKRVFEKPQKVGPVFIEPLKNKGRGAGWACIIQEETGKLRMWYESTPPVLHHDVATAGVWGKGTEYGYFPERMEGSYPEHQIYMIGYAESDDGINWNTPELGIIDWNGSTKNNYVVDGSWGAEHGVNKLDAVSVLYDEDAPQNERYKLILHWENQHVWDNAVSKLDRPEEDMKKFWSNRAKYMLVSPDGIHWERKLIWIKDCSGGGDYCGITRDERNKKWWFNERPLIGIPGIGFRAAGLTQSDNLYEWKDNIQQIFYLDEYEENGLKYQHHGMTPFNYGDQDLGFLELSIIGCPKSAILGSHRDGEQWILPNGKNSFLSVGDQGSYDDEMVCFTRNAPVVVGDELYLYYSASSAGFNDKEAIDTNDHINYILKTCRSTRKRILCLAKLRLDGFAGMTVDPMALARDNRPAYLQTQPIEVIENDLRINIKNSDGTAKVGLYYENARPIEGYELENCLYVEDGVRTVVRWKERDNIASLKGKKIIVLIRLHKGTIYAVKL